MSLLGPNPSSMATMLPSYSDALSTFFSLHEQAENWKTGAINITVATAYNNDAPLQIDLSSTVGFNQNVPSQPKRSDANCYWLEAKFNVNTPSFRQEVIHPIFARSCHSAGFTIHAEYYNAQKCIQFECTMSKYHDEEREKSCLDKRERIVKNPSKPPVARPNRRSQRPVKADSSDVGDDGSSDTKKVKKACPFRFRLYWDETRSRWFLPRQQRGCLDHCGHLQENPEFLRIRTKFAPTEEIQLSEDALECHISATETSNLLSKRTGLNLEWHQMHYLKEKKKNDAVMDAHESLGTGKANITAVDRLLADLENDPKSSYVALFGEFDSGLLTIKTKRKTMNNSIEIDAFTDDLGDATDNPETLARDSRSRTELTHSASGKIVLAVAWTNTEARRKFDMYPEFMGGDDTEDTNSEDRPLYTLCGKDNMNKSFGHTWCFMPSKCKWVYSWILGNAVPTLHPGTATKRVQLFSTDACPHETSAAESVCGNGVDMTKVYPNAHHRHCAWHKVNRNFTEDSKYKSKISAARKTGVSTSIEIDMIVRWLWYFIKYYECADEVDLAMMFLQHYLTESQDRHYGTISDDLRKEMREFITKSFQCNGNKLFEASFADIMSMGNVTTAINECEHRVYKKHSQGPRPQHDLAEARKRIDNINERKEGAKSRKVAADMKSSLGKAKEREMKDDRLTDYCNELLLEEQRQAGKYCTYRASEFLFYVKRMYFDHNTSPEEDLALPEQICNNLFEKIDVASEDLDLKPRARNKLEQEKEALFTGGKKALEEYKVLLSKIMQDVIPRFERTRVLRVVPVPGTDEFIIECDCNRFKKWGLACRHMYAILKRYPRLQDGKVRWLIGYGYYYGRNEILSKHLIKMRDECDLNGVPLSREEWNKIDREYKQSNVPVEYFTRSLGKLCLRGPNYWLRHAETLSAQLGIDRSVLGCAPCAESNKRDVPVSNPLGNVTPKAQSRVATAPIGAVQKSSCNDNYKVPSQADHDDIDFGRTDPMGFSDDESHQVGGKYDIDPYFNYLHVYKSVCGGDKAASGNDKNLYEDYMPMYQQSAKLAKGLGSQGSDIMSRGFNEIQEKMETVLREGLSQMRSDLTAAHTSADQRKTSGMVSGPQLVHIKRKSQRKTTPWSPAKKPKKS